MALESIIKVTDLNDKYLEELSRNKFEKVYEEGSYLGEVFI